ncbi:MAG TPA: FMN reductase [Candidatus Angelobacter sp.]|nr:FMN reductase [Candidatus Angelobacter sp.]
MTARSLVVVTAGLSQPSSTRLLADRLVAGAERALGEAGVEVATTVVELRDHAQDLVNHLLTGFPPRALQGTIDAVVEADGLIAVTPIFSGSYSGLFKLFFDVVEHEALEGMPVLIGATGGTARHSLALDHAVRPLFTYLGGTVMRTAVYAASEDWGQAGAPADGALTDRIARAGAELAAAMAGSPRVRPSDPFDEPIPFEQLLGRPPTD